MNLEGLFKSLDRFEGLSCDSKSVSGGYIFVAIKGTSFDGHDYIGDAIRRGAKLVVIQEGALTPRDAEGVEFIVSNDTRQTLARLAAQFYGFPSKSLRVIGITGTNGKTTVSYLLESILKACGRSPGVIGTVNYRYKNKIFPAGNTTPGAIKLQSMLAQMHRAGCDCAILEVSSHALDQERAGEIEFASGIFTNLSQDHLDYHLDMENYFRAKEKLFTGIPAANDRFIITNNDDPYGRRIGESAQAKVVTYGIDSEADFAARNISFDNVHTSFQIISGKEKYKINTELIGRHNVYNLTAAFAWAIEEGLDPEKLRGAIERFRSVPGRLERIVNNRGISVFVDYAHTEDALRSAILTLKELSHKRLILVFGCGGQRDKGKRPKMGQVASQLADQVMITDDNPRGEDPEEIINQIKKGFREKNYSVIRDRREAIEKAILLAEAGDILLVAGKGHEDVQIIGKKRIPFDDRKIIRECLK
ncbi:UDP-N-acetylmuramoyl-L-alanyl-D-glutamate--2,6-diaminopimelate ligase [Candidatus Omnitrophota bacterium]